MEKAVYSCLFPVPSQHKGSRSVYFPQRSTNQKGLLGYAGNWNDNAITAIQVETQECLNNLEDIGKVKELDIIFMGRNDLAMSMGLFEKYEFPHMYSSKEMQEAEDHLLSVAKKNNKIAGIFLFGTDQVEHYLKKGFNFISIGNDLHHLLQANQASVNNLRVAAKNANLKWEEKESNLVQWPN